MKLNLHDLLLCFFLGTITVLFNTQPVNATNVTVNNMTSLQTALGGSADTIYVSPLPGIYTITSTFTIPRSVCIMGKPSGGQEVIIQTTGNFRHFSYNGAYDLELKDMVLIGPNANYVAGSFSPITPTTDGGGVFAQNGNLKVSGCKIGGCQSPTDGGAILSNVNPLSIDHSVFQFNNARGHGGSIIARGASSPLVLDSVAIRNSKAGFDRTTQTVSLTGNGGAMEAGSTCTLKGNIILENNETYGDGGALFKHVAGNFITTGLTLFVLKGNFTYTGDGGGICTYTALTLDNSAGTMILSDNKAGRSGGAVQSRSTLTLKDVAFTNNKAGYNPATATISNPGIGGAVDARAALLLQGNVTFTGNEAQRDGGAIYKDANGVFDVSGISTLTIQNNNTYVGSGGGIYTAAALTLDNTTNNLVLSPNTAGAHGGAIAAIGSLGLKNTTISNCKAGYNPNTSLMSQGGSGGAVIAYNTLTLEGNVVFQDNQAYSDGGAIFKAATGNFDVSGITNLTIKDNATYTSQGGGICTHAALTLDNTANNLVLSPNTAGLHGGAIAAFAPLTLKNTTISNCKAGYNPNTSTISQTGRGGAIYTNSPITFFGDIKFEKDSAYNDGGAICMIAGAELDANTNINSFIARNNNARIGRGGAIAAFGTGLTVINISNATFEDNTAMSTGGAIYAYGKVSLSYSTFHNNKSSNNGGGLFKDYSNSFPLDIRKCTFSNNSAVNGGGIFTGESSGNTISNSTFSQNTATTGGGGGFYSSGNNAFVNMTLNTFNGNTSASGATAIHFANGTNKVLNGCIVYGNGTGTELSNPGQSDYNIIRDINLTGTSNMNVATGNGGNIFATASGDLGTLANNGGETQTLAIKKNGLAYNYIPLNDIQSWEAAFGGAGSLTSDQCDSLRNGCMGDVGAFEVQDEDVPVIALKNNAPVCYGSLLNADTLIVSATFMNDTIYSSNSLLTDTLSMPLTITTQNRIYVQFTTTSNCKIDTFIDLIINPLPVVTITNTNPSVCQNSSLTMTANMPGGIWSNKYPAIATINASTGVITAISAGTDTIYYTYTNPSGCSDSDTTILTVLPLPVVTITNTNPSVCLNGGDTTLTANITGGVWSSSNPLVATINTTTGTASPVSVGSTQISYTFTNGNGCSATATTTLTVYVPSVNINPLLPSVCINDSLFMQASQGGGTWNSANPLVATIDLNTGLIKAVSAGTTQISYYYTDSGGCSVTESTQLTVHGLPSVNFSYQLLSPPDPDYTVQLAGQSPDSILSWAWDLGDGNTSIVRNPKHIYSASGIYQVELNVVSLNGCHNSYMDAVDTDENIEAGFDVDTQDQCLINNVFVFTNKSIVSGSDATPVSWHWSFGDGSVSLLENPQHTYATEGIYKVTLSATTKHGKHDTFDMLVSVSLTPKVDFVPDVNSCGGDIVPEITFSGPVPGTIYHWMEQPGSDNIGQSVKQGFNKMLNGYTSVNNGNSTLNVNYKVTSQVGGCRGDSIYFNIQVNPVAGINPVAGQTYCNNGSAPAYPFTGNLPNATYKWEWVGGDKLNNLPLSGENIFPAFQTSNQTGATQTAIYQAWAESGNNLQCSGDSIIFTISIFPSSGIALTANLMPVCPYEKNVIFTYTTDLLLPVEYRIEFDQHARSNGFSNIPDTKLSGGSISIPLPPGITSGLYNGHLYTAIAGCTDSVAYPVVVSVMIAGPVITEQPHDIVFCSGDTEFSIEVKTLQEATESYQWYKNGKRIDGATQSIYTVLNPSDEDAGLYYVEITNKCSTTKSEPAEVVRNPFGILTKWNSTVLFVSNVDIQNNLHKYVRYQWYLDEQEIEGAVHQYYEIPEGESGYYKVRAYHSDESMDESCPSFHSRGGIVPKFSIYPNPVAKSGNVLIEIEVPQGEEPGFRVELYDLLGTRVIDRKIQGNSTQLPVNAQPGTYIVRITNSNGVSETKKLIVSQ